MRVRRVSGGSGIRDRRNKGKIKDNEIEEVVH